MTPLRVTDLVKRFGPPGSSAAVDGLSFTIAPGSITALLGGNGAGKTTTISMLLGLLTPTSGQIEVLGIDMVRNRYAALPRLNFSSPYVELPFRLTVRQNLAVYGRLYNVPRLTERIDEVLEDLSLTALRDRPLGSLSAGQKTRAGLAKALINKPELLLLDEPTASLDPDTGDWVRTYLAQFQAKTGATLLLASHNMGEVERLADRVLMMRAGKLVDDNTPAGLIAQYGRTTLEEVFLDIARAGRTEPA